MVQTISWEGGSIFWDRGCCVITFVLLLNHGRSQFILSEIKCNIFSFYFRKRQEEDLPCILTDVEEIPPLSVFKIFGHQWLLWDGVPLCGDAIFHNNGLCREFLLVGDLENVADSLDMVSNLVQGLDSFSTEIFNILQFQ